MKKYITVLLHKACLRRYSLVYLCAVRQVRLCVRSQMSCSYTFCSSASILTLLIILNLVFPGALLRAEGQEEAKTPEHAYNKGIDFYNNLDYNKAIDQFLGAFNTSNSTIEQWINYNLGSATCSKGQKVQESNPQEAQQSYKKALEFFRRAIELNPQDKNAKHNYELTALKLEQAKQQQQEQKKDKQQKQQEQNQEQKQQDQQKESGDDQDQSSDEKEEQGQQGEHNSRQDTQPQEMTKEQAKMLLENFQNSEDGPTELRQLQQAAQDSSPEKDW